MRKALSCTTYYSIDYSTVTDDFDLACNLLKKIIASRPNLENPLEEFCFEISNRISISSPKILIHRNLQPPYLLILLDMNGTLMLRSDKKLLVGEHSPLHHNDRFYYFRPHVKELVSWLLNMKFVDFAFYTSMRRCNANVAVNYILGEENTAHLYDQSFNKHDPLGENQWSMLRDLERIWGTSGAPGYGHNDTSTLMIDDSPIKMREHPQNVLVVQEYTERSVINGGDESLSLLMLRLQHIFDSWVGGNHNVKDLLE